MSNRRSILRWVVFLMLIAAAMVFWFFEKKEKEIQKSIHQLEEKNEFRPKNL